MLIIITIHQGKYRGEFVAIKELSVSGAIQNDSDLLAEFIKVFDQEVLILSQLKHKNIVNIIGCTIKSPHFCNLILQFNIFC